MCLVHEGAVTTELGRLRFCCIFGLCEAGARNWGASGEVNVMVAIEFRTMHGYLLQGMVNGAKGVMTGPTLAAAPVKSAWFGRYCDRLQCCSVCCECPRHFVFDRFLEGFEYRSRLLDLGLRLPSKFWSIWKFKALIPFGKE